MASSAKPPLIGRFAGSVSEDVLNMTNRPVLLIGPSVPTDVVITNPTLIAGVDSTDVAEATVAAIASWTATFGGGTPRIAEVVPTMNTLTAGDLNPTAHLRHFATLLGDVGITASSEIVPGGDVAQALEDLAATVPDPVFVTISSNWTDGHIHWHSTTRQLVEDSAHPVLVVPVRRSGTSTDVNRCP